MRIGFVTTEYVTESYFSGGLANYLHRVAKALISAGHEVHIVTLSEVGWEEFHHDGIFVHRVMADRPRKWIDRLTRGRLPSTAQWLGFSLQAYRKIKQLDRQTPFDILQFPNSRGCGLVTSLLLRVPYVVRISCYRPVWNKLSGIDPSLDSRATEWIELIQLRLSRHIYAPSYCLKEVLEAEAGMNNVQVLRTPSFVESPRFDHSLVDQSLKGRAYLLFFGRFQLHKGFHVLVHALPQVLKTNPGLHVALVGLDCKTSVAPSMKDYALSVCGPHAHRVIILGQTPHAQLYPIIAHARLIVLPSLIDNLPNTCLEAMALGKPVIGTIGASFDEVITDGENGFLVPPGDADALAAKILAAWVHPRLDDIGLAGKETIRELAPERTVQELLAYYNAILNGNA